MRRSRFVRVAAYSFAISIAGRGWCYRTGQELTEDRAGRRLRLLVLLLGHYLLMSDAATVLTAAVWRSPAQFHLPPSLTPPPPPRVYVTRLSGTSRDY